MPAHRWWRCYPVMVARFVLDVFSGTAVGGVAA
jgi:hypothetical protein